MLKDAFAKLLPDAIASGAASLASIDLMAFKELNDAHGFEAGDTVLEAVTRALVGNLPASAAVCRRGGDEWLVLFPGTSPEQALILLEEVRSLVESRPASEKVPEPVRLKVGIAGAPVHASDADSLFRAAEDALHRAKDAGGVAMYVEERMALKSNYYPKGRLGRLAKLSDRLGRTEASLLREALDDVLEKYAGA